MGKFGTLILKEIREALPAIVFFLVLFHLIGLTKALLLQDYSITALRTVGATIGALVVAKAILVVEALPVARVNSDKRMYQVLWKAFLYSVVVLLFRILEEAIPLFAKHDGVITAAKAMYDEVAWPLFWVVALWTTGGLVLYSLAAELVEALGAARIKEILFGKRRL